MEFILKELESSFDGKLDVYIDLDDQNFIAKFRITGNIDQIILPLEKDNGERKYDLWEETCFELFLKYPDNSWYIEFNMSPTTDWNSFFMSHYREHVGELETVKNVEIRTERKYECYSLVAKIKFNEINQYAREDFLNNKIEIGISAITKYKDGKNRHWALNFGEKAPDFHDSKTYQLLSL